MADPASHPFDDGSAAIPSGLAGTPQRVIVVGAGIAGLTVANALVAAGVECLVVEARDRIGGRLCTAELAGHPVDLGASWIHSPVGNPLRSFADCAGVACRDGNPIAEMVAYDPVDRRRLSHQEFAELGELMFGRFQAAPERLTAELGDEATAAEGIERFLAQQGLEGAAERRARAALRMLVEADYLAAPEQVSLRWLWDEMEYGGDYLGDLPVGGFRRLVAAMAAGVPVRLGFEVAEIAAGSDGVAVRTADGAVEQASHVVVTLPLGVLKRGRVRFSPPLPDQRLAAINRLGFGSLEKVALAFERPFWRDAGVPHLFALPRDPGGSVAAMLGKDAFEAGPIMVCFVNPANQGHLRGRSPDEAAAWALRLLAEAIDHPCPDPTEIAVTSWATDPHACGSYTHIPLGARPADCDLLGQPLLGRLLWAGEATWSPRMGYADGAMTSGIREAKRLLGSADVRLTARPAADAGSL